VPAKKAAAKPAAPKKAVVKKVATQVAAPMFSGNSVSKVSA